MLPIKLIAYFAAISAVATMAHETSIEKTKSNLSSSSATDSNDETQALRTASITATNAHEERVPFTVRAPSKSITKMLGVKHVARARLTAGSNIPPRELDVARASLLPYALDLNHPLREPDVARASPMLDLNHSPRDSDMAYESLASHADDLNPSPRTPQLPDTDQAKANEGLQRASSSTSIAEEDYLAAHLARGEEEDFFNKWDGDDEVMINIGKMVWQGHHEKNIVLALNRGGKYTKQFVKDAIRTWSTRFDEVLTPKTIQWWQEGKGPEEVDQLLGHPEVSSYMHERVKEYKEKYNTYRGKLKLSKLLKDFISPAGVWIRLEPEYAKTQNRKMLDKCHEQYSKDYNTHKAALAKMEALVKDEGTLENAHDLVSELKKQGLSNKILQKHFKKLKAVKDFMSKALTPGYAFETLRLPVNIPGKFKDISGTPLEEEVPFNYQYYLKYLDQWTHANPQDPMATKMKEMTPESFRKWRRLWYLDELELIEYSFYHQHLERWIRAHPEDAFDRWKQANKTPRYVSKILERLELQDLDDVKSHYAQYAQWWMNTHSQ